MKVTEIKKVKKTAHHQYAGQGETVIYANTNHSPKYRWFLGWGGGHVPVTKAQVEEAELSREYIVPTRDDGSAEYEEALGYVGMAVPVYINQ